MIVVSIQTDRIGTFLFAAVVAEYTVRKFSAASLNVLSDDIHGDAGVECIVEENYVFEVLEVNAVEFRQISDLIML